MDKHDPVNHPKHYTQYPHEVIELTEQLGFCLGNAVKYILRADYKGHKSEDLKKAAWYIRHIIERKTNDKQLIQNEIRGWYPGIWDDELGELTASYKNEFVANFVTACVDNDIPRLHRYLLRLELAASQAEVEELKAKQMAHEFYLEGEDDGDEGIVVGDDLSKERVIRAEEVVVCVVL